MIFFFQKSLKDIERLSIFRQTVILENKKVLSYFEWKVLWIPGIIKWEKSVSFCLFEGIHLWKFFSIAFFPPPFLKMWHEIIDFFLFFFYFFKSDSYLPKEFVLFAFRKPFKNDEKCFLFHLKSSLRFFSRLFGHVGKAAWLES